MSAIDEDLERCLVNWGRWKNGNVDFASSDWSDPDACVFRTGDRYREARMPILAGEALDLDRFIRTLHERGPDNELTPRGALTAWYARLLPHGGFVPSYWTQADIARACGCSVATFERRLLEGRRAIADALSFKTRS